ncbi:MAG: hypothetical protein ACYCZW_01090 [Minisyncoccota bacterium]
MELFSNKDFGNLSLLGILWDGKISEDHKTGVRSPKRSKIVYHLQFIGEHWDYHYEGERAEDVVDYFCKKFKITAEHVGYDAYILRETLPGKVRNPSSFLFARFRSVQGIYKMLWKNEQRIIDIAREPADGDECHEYHNAYAEMTAFGQTFGGSKLDPSHTRKCQKCRFWKAEHDRKIAKVDSKPGTHIDEVC